MTIRMMMAKILSFRDRAASVPPRATLPARATPVVESAVRFYDYDVDGDDHHPFFELLTKAEIPALVQKCKSLLFRPILSRPFKETGRSLACRK